MQRKMTRLARARIGGTFADSPGNSADRAISPLSASEPNPHEAEPSMRRREKIRSVDIAEFVGGKQRLAERRPGLRAGLHCFYEEAGIGEFGGRRRALESPFPN